MDKLNEEYILSLIAEDATKKTYINHEIYFRGISINENAQYQLSFDVHNFETYTIINFFLDIGVLDTVPSTRIRDWLISNLY